MRKVRKRMKHTVASRYAKLYEKEITRINNNQSEKADRMK